MLSLENITKTYDTAGGAQVLALDDVSVDIETGSFVSLIGPSGCGKTTLLKIAAGLVSKSSGSVAFNGSSGPPAPGSYGMVFQTASLLPWLTIRRNITFPAEILKQDRRKAEDRAADLLDLVQLGGNEDRYPSELSGGMQQRASIARSLIHDPPILFMDEPFGAVDAMTREDLNFQLQRVHLDQKKTILFVTHSISEAVLLSDKVVVLRKRPGRVAATEVIELPRPRTVETMTSPAFNDAVRRIRMLLDDASERRAS